MAQTLSWILIILGALLILAEVVLGAISGFDFLLLGSAIVIGGVLGLATGSAAAAVAAAGALALAYVLFGRKSLRSRLRRPGLLSNTDMLLGKIVSVSETIAPGRPGRVKFEGEEWRAEIDGPRGGSVEAGREAKVSRIDGVTVYVIPVEAENPPGGTTR